MFSLVSDDPSFIVGGCTAPVDEMYLPVMCFRRWFTSHKWYPSCIELDSSEFGVLGTQLPLKYFNGLKENPVELLFINCRNANLSPPVLNANNCYYNWLFLTTRSICSWFLSPTEKISFPRSFGFWVLSVSRLGPKSWLDFDHKTPLPHWGCPQRQHMANRLWFDDTCFICKSHKNEWVGKVQMLEGMT